MAIRNAAKALIVHDGSLLLNVCYKKSLGEYYAMPGGGQEPYETMAEAISRECLEETGYEVIAGDFVGLYEEIHLSEAFRRAAPDYAHKILHIFRCTLKGCEAAVPSGQDAGQQGCRWVPLEALGSVCLLPAVVGENIHALLDTEHPLVLGSHFI